MSIVDTSKVIETNLNEGDTVLTIIERVAKTHNSHQRDRKPLRIFAKVVLLFKFWVARNITGEAIKVNGGLWMD